MNDSTLHIFRLAPSRIIELNDCINLTTENDAIVLIDDGSYASTQATAFKLLEKTTDVYVISEHLMARAISAHKEIKSLPLSELHNILFLYKNSITWQ